MVAICTILQARVIKQVVYLRNKEKFYDFPLYGCKFMIKAGAPFMFAMLAWLTL